jgi:HSP20 family protein
MSILTSQNGRKEASPADAHRTTGPFISPTVNIHETKDGHIVQAEMPGVSKEGLDIGLEGNTLTIHGRRAMNDLVAESLYRESSTADYQRVFELDPAIDTARIDAKIEQGVLTIQLPKSERVKPRKIVVND